MIPKLWLIGGAVVAFAAWTAGTAWFFDSHGYDRCKVSYQDATLKAVAEDKVKVEKVVEYRDKIKVVYRERIKEIEVAKDPTGCADAKLTDMGFGLHQDRQD